MKSLTYYIVAIFMLCGMAGFAQQSTREPVRIELEEGKVVIESFTVKQLGDSLQIELSDLKLLNANSPTVQRFDVPMIIAFPSPAIRTSPPSTPTVLREWLELAWLGWKRSILIWSWSWKSISNAKR